MISVKVMKGLSLPIEGKPSKEFIAKANPDRVAVLPEKIPFIKPKLHVDIDDTVRIGSLLFEDKHQPDVKFLSPGGGKIIDIAYGPRRVIEKIVIELAEEEQREKFESVPYDRLDNMDSETLKRLLLKGGMWPFFKQLPYYRIADPTQSPPAVIVSLSAKEPFQPEPEVYLEGAIDLFEYGIRMLQRLCPTVHVVTAVDNAYVLKELLLKKYDELITHTVEGEYPADDPGAFVYHTKKSAEENRSWYIHGQDLLPAASLLKTGEFPIDRTVVIAGSSAPEKKHVRTRCGAPLDYLLGDHHLNGDARYIVGGLFRGYITDKESFMGLYETSLIVSPKGKNKELFGFLRPGTDKLSASRAFWSHFKKTNLRVDGGLHGDPRACINCGSCEKVCPVDMLPQFTFKCILADEIEEALAHGLLDCVECGLCTFICPSKIEILDMLKDAKASYYKEMFG